jgi:cobalamin synthase
MSSALSRFQQNSMQIARAAVVALAVLSMLMTMMPAIMSNVDPDGNPNPFSTEYGGYLRMWAATIMLAIALFAPAFACAGRRGRPLLLATAMVVAAVSVGPARHYYRYFHCENGMTVSPCLPPLLHEIFPNRM